MTYDRKKFDAQLVREYDAEIRKTDEARATLGAAAGSGDIVVDGSDHTDSERLAYYRSHGLACCADYPGGDA